MSMIYGMVARGDAVVLTEISELTGNFQQIARQILSKIQANTMLTITYGNDYLFHYINENGFTFMCMGEKNFQKRLAFAWLKDIKEKFNTEVPALKKEGMQYSLDKDPLNRYMKERMNFYNHDPSADQIRNLKQNVDDVKNIMVQNIDKILARQEKIDILVKKTDNMVIQSTTFKKSANTIKKEMWWKNMKLKIIIAIIVLIVILIIVLFATKVI